MMKLPDRTRSSRTGAFGVRGFRAGVSVQVFVSSPAVADVVFPDRPLTVGSLQGPIRGPEDLGRGRSGSVAGRAGR